jgi:hypothetical protein
MTAGAFVTLPVTPRTHSRRPQPRVQRPLAVPAPQPNTRSPASVSDARRPARVRPRPASPASGALERRPEDTLQPEEVAPMLPSGE